MQIAGWVRAAAVAAGLMCLGTGVSAEGELVLSEDGLYVQPWFKQATFLELKDDLAEAEAAGKRLVVLWEQRGCPYCRELHQVNLQIPEIVEYIKARYDVIQFNLWGDREVTDFDGEVLSEKKFARKLRINYTPSIVFFDEGGAEVFRMPGYFKPFHFIGAFEYVFEKGYEQEPSFQRWLQGKAERMAAQGKKIELWQ